MRRAAALLTTTAVLLGACSTVDDEREAAPRSGAASVQATATPSTPVPMPVQTPEEKTLPPLTDPVSLPALMREEPDGGRPRILRTIETTVAFIRYAVLYRSGDTQVSGVMLRPRGQGPFPGIVLNHGYIEPSSYVTGQGLAREQVALATNGFVVLHTDYRGHAASDPADELEREARLGYVRDAANAVDALRKLSYVDDDRLAMLGRSMGGGVTHGVLVTHPGLVDAAVIYASVSSRFVENQRHFSDPGRPATVDAFEKLHGTEREAPGFYAGLSNRSYVDRITEPVLSLHGSIDRTCPPRWARETQRAMTRAGVDSTLQFYEGEDHAFDDRWQESMDRSIRFIRQQFRSA